MKARTHVYNSLIKVKLQRGLCGLCWNLLPDNIHLIDPDHIEPKGMGGASHDSHESNLQAVHRLCNLRKGSKRMEDPLLLVGPYLEYIEGLECFCGKKKLKERPTCLWCWVKLPEQTQHDLNHLTNREHAAALVEAKKYLEAHHD